MEALLDKHCIIGGELECRIRTLSSANFFFNTNKKVQLPTECEVRYIDYYSSLLYPNLTIRCINKKYETKELLLDYEENNIKYALSVEKKLLYTDNFSLIFDHSRKVTRYIIEKNVTFDYDGFEGLIEVECFNNESHKDFLELVEKYKIFSIPECFLKHKKPMEVSINKLIEVINRGNFSITPKIDGIHVMIAVEGDKMYAVNDFGVIVQGELYSISESSIIFEGEKIDNIMYSINSEMNRPDLNIFSKPDIKVYDRDDLIIAIEELSEYKAISDGYIIKEGKDSYKSKFLSTTDYKYCNGRLILGNKTYINYRSDKLVNGQIYEVDSNNEILRVRKDKKVPNRSKPISVGNEINKIISGEGVYCLRYHNNRLKSYLLETLDFDCILVDIGSGQGGDVKKWENNDHIKRVISFDPNMGNFLCSKVTKYIDKFNIKYLTNMELPIVTTIFYVPWDNSFLDLFKLSVKTFIITWNKPVIIKNSIYTVSKIDNKYILSIPHTRTATNVIESNIFVPDFNPMYSPLGQTKFFTAEERDLLDMYSVYMI